MSILMLNFNFKMNIKETYYLAKNLLKDYFSKLLEGKTKKKIEGLKDKSTIK
jgi:hypothetical protein